MISKGYREFGVITGKLDNMHSTKRLVGIQKAMFEAGIPFNPDIVVEGDWGRESGYTSAKILIEKGVKCIFCMNDLMAAGVYDYLHENGISAGKDVMIFGYDNREISDYMYPRLSTYDLKLEDLAKKAAEIMLDILDENKDTSDYQDNYIAKIPGELVVRESI